MTAPDTIEILYSCQACGLRDAAVRAPVRGDEKVLSWMRIVEKTLAEDHRQRSPQCHTQWLFDIKIPMTGRGSKIGGPVIE